MSYIQPPDGEELDFLAACLPEQTHLDDFVQKITKYGEFLYQTNQFLNLTAVSPDSFWTKHICDSVLLLREIRGQLPLKNLADVGCGAGLPSLPLAAAMPELAITSMDSKGKKIKFLQDAAVSCNLTNLHAIHGRANELAANPDFNRKFSFITARAVASADVLVKECRRLLNPNGVLCIYRTESQLEEEWGRLQKMKMRMIKKTIPVELPHQAGRRLFLFLQLT